MKIARHVSKEKANYPFVVQVQNTENWNSSQAFKVELDAIKLAEELAKTFPRLPVRVCHYTGGPMGEQNEIA